MPYALQNILATKERGKPVWFRFWTQIGPCSTSKPEERALFKSEEESKQNSAYAHPLCFFEPVEVEEKDGGDFNWNK